MSPDCCAASGGCCAAPLTQQRMGMCSCSALLCPQKVKLMGTDLQASRYGQAASVEL